MSPQEYKLISASSPEELNKLVNEHLVKGWMLFGTPTVSNADHMSCFCQAITIRRNTG